MKRLILAGIVAVTAATAGCAGGGAAVVPLPLPSHGDYSFFRDPAEQLEINRAYDAEVAARQGVAPPPGPVGATRSESSGTVEYWRH